jgi:hypothetical protein
VVSANALLAPINPVLPSLGLTPGEPFQPNYFHHSLNISPSFGAVEQLVATIPRSASVAVSTAMYPLLGNYPRAYVLVPAAQNNASHLSFNLSAGPQYVLVSPGAFRLMGPLLQRNVSNPDEYGMRGFVGSTSVGPVLLYEKGYRAPAQLFGAPLPRTAALYGPGSGLAAGPHGAVGPNDSSPSGEVIQSLNVIDRAGLVWRGPDIFLPPGNYSLEVRVAMSGENLTSRPNSGALRVILSGYGGIPVNETVRASAFSPGVWTNLTFGFSLTDPLPDVNIDGYLASNEYSLAVAWAMIAPTST